MPWQVQLAELQSKLGAANVEAQHFPGVEYEKAMAISSTKTGGIAPFFFTYRHIWWVQILMQPAHRPYIVDTSLPEIAFEKFKSRVRFAKKET